MAIMALLVLLTVMLLLIAVESGNVIFWEHSGERGKNFHCRNCVLPVLPNVGGFNFNDEISHIEIQGPCEVEVFHDINFGGPYSGKFTTSQDFRHSGWNDAISSVMVHCSDTTQVP